MQNEPIKTSNSLMAIRKGYKYRPQIESEYYFKQKTMKGHLIIEALGQLLSVRATKDINVCFLQLAFVALINAKSLRPSVNQERISFNKRILDIDQTERLCEGCTVTK